MSHKPVPTNKDFKDERSMTSLRLNYDLAASTGKIWLLLPDGFRYQEAGHSYPLPNRLVDLQRLSALHIPPRNKCAGAIYIRRAVVALRERNRNRQSATLDMAQRQHSAKIVYDHFKEDVRQLTQKAKEERERVRDAADEAIASLTQLFDLGRKGLDAQMQAHLHGTEWQGERINARAFRECFRMVTQAVKGLGVPSDQRAAANESIMREAAAALEATQDAIAMAPGPDPDAKPS